MEKHPGGRPMKYTNPEEMQARMDDYFSSCEGTVAVDSKGVPILDKRGQPIILGKRPLSITGLAYSLGLTRRGFLNYKHRLRFSAVVSRAYLRVEAYTAERLFDREGYTGARFILENCFGWGKAEIRKDTLPAVVIIRKQ